MPVPKGTKFGGRKKGTPNKVTATARETIALFIDANAHRLQEWIDEVARTDARAALTCFKDLIEFHVPKLGRTELTGADGGPLAVQVVRYSQIAEPMDAKALSDGRMAATRTGNPPRSARVASKERQG